MDAFLKIAHKDPQSMYKTIQLLVTLYTDSDVLICISSIEAWISIS